MSWHNHTITAVGSRGDIKRFVRNHELVSGAIDRLTGRIAEGYERAPKAKVFEGGYRVNKCSIGVCDVEIELETYGTAIDSVVAGYRSWTAAYPTLRIIWRYSLGGKAVGYVDNAGDHRFREVLQETTTRKGEVL